MAVLFAAPVAPAQVATGTPPFASFSGGPDIINNANLNVHLSIPVEYKAGRGMPFSYNLTYDSSIWYPVTASGATTWQPLTNWGWPGVTTVTSGYFTSFTSQANCFYPPGSNGKVYWYTIWSDWAYHDAGGATHWPYLPGGGSVSNMYTTTPCTSTGPPSQATGSATDGSGWSATVYAGGQGTAYYRNGDTLNAPGPGSAGPIVDTNGNEITNSVQGTATTFTDTLGTTALTVSALGGGSSATYTYTGPNGNAVYTVKYSPQTVQTSFGCSGIGEYGPTQQYLVSEIDLPDSSKYTFGYEGTPSHSGNVTGRLHQVTLPTGGTITYTYPGGNDGITCADGSTANLTRTLNPGNGGTQESWSYAHTESSSTAWGTTITDAQNNQTVMNFQTIYETERQVAGLETVVTCYNNNPNPCTNSSNSTSVSLPINQRTVTTTLGSEESETNTYYNINGLMSTIDEYDFGNGSVGAFKRETMTCYASLSNPNILNRPSYVLVYSATGNASNCTGTSGLAAETAYTYDSNGNMLSETHSNTGGSPASVSRSFTYGSYGVLQTSTDFNGNQATYSNTACSNSFPTTITPPITSLPFSVAWNCYGAVPTWITDANGQTTTFSYDNANNFWRLSEIGYPDGGQETITYTDTQGAFTVANSRLVTTGSSHTVTQTLDGLGRVVKSVDAQACSEVDTAYDSVGRVYTVSNPYCTTSSGATTYGYDGLSRLNSITYPDTGAASLSYSGNCATAADAASKTRTLCLDGLGRINSVTEDPGQSPHLNYQTTYTYDDLNDLTGVAQGSSQTRTYGYDMLARLTSARTPEVNVGGTRCSTTYGHDANGNVTSRTAPLENQISSCSTTVTTTYTYDGLNRLLTKTYSDSTPPASFSYDQASVTIGSWSSGTLTNPKGRLTEATTTSGSSIKTAVVYSYDPVGRISDFWQCNPSNCGTSTYAMPYTYDKAGDVTSWSHPGQINFTNSVNAAQQITGVQTTSQYSNLPQSLAQNVTYTPWGAVSQLQNGCAGSGCVNALETYTYNNRLQPWMIQLTGITNGGYCLVYNYYADESNPTSCTAPAQGTNNNGNVMGYWYQDSVQSGFSHTGSYTYDNVNRLLTAMGAPSGSGTVSYNLNFNNYDQYGNMACVQNANTNGPCPQWAYSTGTNQLSSSSGCTYDAAGNLTKDCSNAPAHTYQWDAEGRVASVDSGATWSFTYNALGERVQWVYSNGAATYEHMFDPNGGWLGINGVLDVLRWGDGDLAWYTGTETYFNHLNSISSTTMLTNHAGTAVEDILFYPWGQMWQLWGSGGAAFAELPYNDAGNTNTNLTMFRLQSPGLGRWLSPDRLGGDITNPQSLNRYAYVLNSPTSMVDPLGLDGCNVNNVSYEGSGNPPWTECAGISDGGYSGSFDTDPTDLECAYVGSYDASCQQPPGLWPNGNPIYTSAGGGGGFGIGGAGGGLGSSPLSGDFGPLGYPSAGGWGPPCDFGVCGGPWPQDFRQVQTGLALPMTYWIPEWSDLLLAERIAITAWGQSPRTTGAPGVSRTVRDLGTLIEWDLCGSSPGGAVMNWTISGATKGAVGGAIAGFGGGEVAGGLLGVPGALLGGYLGGHIGAIGGSLWGMGAAGVCSALGVYGK